MDANYGILPDQMIQLYSSQLKLKRKMTTLTLIVFGWMIRRSYNKFIDF